MEGSEYLILREHHVDVNRAVSGKQRTSSCGPARIVAEVPTQQSDYFIGIGMNVLCKGHCCIHRNAVEMDKSVDVFMQSVFARN